MNTLEAKRIQDEKDQLHTLLRESHRHFLERNLKKALNEARIALDFASAGNMEIQRFEALLLLAEIYGTNGRYLREAHYFQTAANQIELAQRSAGAGEAGAGLRMEILQAELALWQGDPAASERALSRALKTKAARNDQSLQVRILTALCRAECDLGRWNKGKKYAEQALELIAIVPASHDSRLNLSKAWAAYVPILIRENAFSAALTYSQKALQLSRDLGDREREIYALYHIALVSAAHSNYKIAMQYFQEALSASEQIGFQEAVCQCLVRIGDIYVHLYNYEEAQEKYNRTLHHFGDQLEEVQRVQLFNKVGNIHYRQGRLKLARAYFENALGRSQKTGQLEDGLYARAQLGRTLADMKEWETAEIMARKALAGFKKLGNIDGNQINLITLGRIAFIQNEPESAEKWLREGIRAAEEREDPHTRIQANKLLAELHQANDELAAAVSDLQEMARIQQVFSRQERNRQFLDLEIRNALKEKQKEIAQLTKENEYKALLLEKGDQIDRKNQELLQMNEDLRQFAYVASHDLKEPLRMIGSYAQIIEKRYGDQFDEKASLYFGYMREGVDRMNKLLDALLQYATIGRSGEDAETLDLNYIVEICKVNLQVLIRESGATIHCRNLPTVFGQKSMLLQLFQNLIANAIKFRKPDMPPEVTISGAEQDGQHLITIQDNGIGIDPEHKDRIFVLFQRLHSRKSYEGTGIGLAICMRIVQRMGGVIWVESESGNGSAFKFTLPTAEE